MERIGFNNLLAVFGSFPSPFYISRTVFSNYLYGREKLHLPTSLCLFSLLLLLSYVHTVLVPLSLSTFSSVCFPTSLNVFLPPCLLSSSCLREKSSGSLIVHLHNYQFHIVILPPLSVLSFLMPNMPTHTPNVTYPSVA